MRRRIVVTERKTPGSIGGGIGLPGGGAGSGGYDNEDKLRRGESGGEKSPKLRSRTREKVRWCWGGGSDTMRGSGWKVAGSRLRWRRDSRSSIGSWSHGPYFS